MNEQEFNAKDLMELERLERRFAKGVPMMEELDKVINALSIVEKLKGELNKLERECEEYEKQLSEPCSQIQRPEKKSNFYLIITLLVFAGIIGLLFVMFQIFGLQFLVDLRIAGMILLVLGFAIGVAGIIVKSKEYKVKKEIVGNDSRLAELQERLEATQSDVNKIKETTLKVEKMACDLLEKYDEPAEIEVYMEKLLQLKNNVDEYTRLKNLQK